jgi:hypothetical protein
MKAGCSATSEEIDIILEKAEIESLENKVLKGFLAIHTEKGKLVRPLNLRVEDIKEHEEGHYLVYLKHDPEKSYYLDSKKFDVILSSDAYQDLKAKGMTGERLWHVAKVLIYEQSKYSDIHLCTPRMLKSM